MESKQVDKRDFGSTECLFPGFTSLGKNRRLPNLSCWRNRFDSLFESSRIKVPSKEFFSGSCSFWQIISYFSFNM